jgi:hypothetical protein
MGEADLISADRDSANPRHNSSSSSIIRIFAIVFSAMKVTAIPPAE